MALINVSSLKEQLDLGYDITVLSYEEKKDISDTKPNSGSDENEKLRAKGSNSQYLYSDGLKFYNDLVGVEDNDDYSYYYNYNKYNYNPFSNFGYDGYNYGNNSFTKNEYRI